ncbi:LysR family transcriptional regulator [Nonomuraea sp. NPDC048916]|uniref:LysR family transcriptional regulator n=1 Tax=Nonomuraea sp. NPDC048916 TaxID=3154232 RepID=UPI00340B61C2
MDTRLLRTFVSVHGTGSFTATAQELAFAQSTVSAHVQALEQRLGVRLFDRLPARVVLTAHGRRLLPLARQILDLAAEAERIGDPANARCAVRLVAPGTICGHRLPQVAALLRQHHPQVQLSVAAAGTTAALEALGDGSADLALVFECELPDIGVRGERIGAERLAVICSPGHPLAGRRAGWQRLAEHEFLLLEEGCSYSDVVARRLGMAAGGRAKVSRFGNVDAIRACVAADLGLSVLPRVTVEEALRTGKLSTIDTPGLPVPRVLLIARTGQCDDPAMDMVNEALRSVFRPSPPSPPRERPAPR